MLLSYCLSDLEMIPVALIITGIAFGFYIPHVLNLHFIIIHGISFMQGIYTYMPETNHVPREHCVATILT